MDRQQEISGQLKQWQATAEKVGQPLVMGQIGRLCRGKGEHLDVPMIFA